uniref:Uncharacterized protein n=1 Tax=Anguilla anguilla TaxID=7936 RepID=A0A0E9URE1_ANGAN
MRFWFLSQEPHILLC